MSIKLDQHLYHLFLNHCKGKQGGIKGIPQATLTKMKRGQSNLTISTIKNALAENGMSGEIKIYGNGTQTTINFFE